MAALKSAGVGVLSRCRAWAQSMPVEVASCRCRRRRLPERLSPYRSVMSWSLCWCAGSRSRNVEAESVSCRGWLSLSSAQSAVFLSGMIQVSHPMVQYDSITMRKVIKSAKSGEAWSLKLVQIKSKTKTV
jgi:hypothetical protein